MRSGPNCTQVSGVFDPLVLRFSIRNSGVACDQAKHHLIIWTDTPQSVLGELTPEFREVEHAHGGVHGRDKLVRIDGPGGK